MATDVPPKPDSVELETIRLFVESVDACLYIKDLRRRYVFANRAVGKLLKVDVAQVIGKRDDCFIDMLRSGGVKEDDEVLEAGVKQELDHEVYLLSGERYVFHTVKVPLFDANNTVIGLCGIAIDMTERAHAIDRIVSDHQLLSTILANVDASIFLKNSDGRYLFANQRVLELFGRTLAEVLGRTDGELLDEETVLRLRQFDSNVLASGTRQVQEEQLMGADGERHYFWTTKMPLRLPGQGTCLLGIATEITELLRLRRLIEHQRITDDLTGLPNRTMFESIVDSRLSSQPDKTFAVAIFDVDQFRYLNNSLGKVVGDRVLQEIGRRLQQCFAFASHVARLSSDEFAVLIPCEDCNTLTADVDAIRFTLSQPYRQEDSSLHLSVSAGVSVSGQDGDTAIVLLAAAEAALYSAKESGRDRYRFYSSTLQSDVLQRAQLERDLRASLGTNQYQLFYQPKIRRDGSIAGMEALLRWERPGNGLTLPDKFIPLAEQLGLLLPIGHWAIERACSQIAEWRGMGLQTVSVAVNLSAAQVATDEILDYVAEMVRRWEVPEGGLELELTESMMMSDPDAAIERLRKLRNLGIILSIDDFGTGFSSMAYLRRLPVHCLKIDKSFVKNIAADTRDANLCDGIMSLAHMLSMKVVAEGIETLEQFEVLRARQCDIFQGYFFSKPLSALDATNFIRQSMEDPGKHPAA